MASSSKAEEKKGTTSALGMLAAAYGDDDDDDDDDDDQTGAAAASRSSTSIVVQAAPSVVDDKPRGHELAMWDAGKEDKKHAQSVVYHNPVYETMWAAEQGPSLSQHEQRMAGVKAKNHYSGHVAQYHPASEFAFDEQYHTFNAHGFALNPSTGSNAMQDDQHGPNAAPQLGVVGDVEKWAEARGGSVFTLKGPLDSSVEETRKRMRLDESGKPLPSAAPALTAEQTAQIEARLKQEKKARRDEQAGRDDAPPAAMEERSIFHGSSTTDYQGRSWVLPPADIKETEHECFIPKKWEHTWSGHTKGVSAIRWFPGNGHLLLSAGMDTKVKIWDVFNTRKCMRTYMGHAAAVRDICFTNDGRRFITCSYDRFCKLWDTETGTCISAFTNKKIPFCVKFNPDPSQQHVFVAGCSNKHIVQYDTNTGKVEQVYDQHLAAVNTITFCEEARRFVTTADDKKMLIWEFGIPVPIKHIADPTLHSMPAVTKSPNDKWLLCQNLDNQITVYTAQDRFKLNRKKVFKGHVVAGYACQPGMSPCGNYVMSGDTDGRLWFWDWKSCKVFRKLKCHDQVCISAIWHPVEPSKVATCSWDGTIKYWD